MAGAKPVLTVLSVGTTVVLLASGCGGGGKKAATSPTTTQAVPTTTRALGPPLGKAEYDAKMRPIGRMLGGSLNSVHSLTGKAGATKALAMLQSNLRSAAAQLTAFTPPAPIKAQHAQLVKAVRELAGELDAVIARVKGGTLEPAAVFATVVGLKGLAAIESASTAIANRGYSIGAG